MIYSGGNGPLFILGVVPNSHLVIIEYNIEDGEIMKQVKIMEHFSVVFILVNLPQFLFH